MELKEIQKGYEKRYIIVDETSGKIIDDAQGYGFKTKQAAHKCYSYKYKGGKEKKDQLIKEARKIIKICKERNILDNIKSLKDLYDYNCFRNFKDYNFDEKLIYKENKKEFDLFCKEVQNIIGLEVDNKLVKILNDLIDRM